MPDDDPLIESQIEYYRARAPEYDEWFHRRGRYDRGEELNRRWFDEAAEVRRALEKSRPGGHILELASGTGLWTVHLAPRAAKLVTVDISAESIAINRNAVANGRVEYIQADIFDWQPPGEFDYIFFAFWLSHVPASRFDGFWQMIEAATAPGGRVFFIDSLKTDKSTAHDHTAPENTGRATRKLNDGRQFEIIKIFYDPPRLEKDLRDRGWHGHVRTTDNFFMYGLFER